MINQLFIYTDELEKLNDVASAEYIINKLQRAGFDLSSDDNVVDSECLDGFVKFTQRIKKWKDYLNYYYFS